MKKPTITGKLRYKLRDFRARLLVLLFPSVIKNVRYSVIVSTGRTGTRTLGFLFDEVSSCISRHEPRPTLLDLLVKKQRGVNDILLLKQFDIRRALFFVKSQREAKVFVESNYTITFLLEFLLPNKPNINAVYVSRNPIDFIVSAYSKEHVNHSHEHRLFDSRDTRERFDPGFYSKWCGSDFDSLSRFEKICWTYRIYHEEYFKLIELGHSIPLFKLEDLTQDEEVIVELAKALDIQLTEKDVAVLKKGIGVTRNASESYVIGKYDSWSSEEQNAFQEIVGPIVPKLGYDQKA